jgi:lipopolysaccharide transport system ATP-binding protein
LSSIAIKIENLSKQYRLGQIGTGTLSHDLNRWWAKIRGKEDPTMKIGSTNTLDTVDGEYVWALKDINLEIQKGEVLGIIGKNGAGKSTLLKILSRVTGPTTGNIKINGRMASLLEVGTGFHPELSGKENIFLNGAILGMTKRDIKSKLDEIVEFSGVNKYLDTPVKRYSSGMYVRLAFAVAAHLEPDILVVDEVLAVGDAEFQKKAIGKMQDVSQKGGRTVLFVSHNMLAVKSLCRTGLLLSNGFIKTRGDIENVTVTYLEVINKAINSFVNIEKESDGFFVKSVKVSNNGINGNFNIAEDLIFEINVTCFKNYGSINVNLFFNTAEESTIFATCSQAEKCTKGNYIFRCVIPANTLNDIIYGIDLMVVEQGPKILHHLKQIITVEGIEDKRDGSWLGKYPGLIRPQYFNWKKMNTDE